MKKYLAVYIKDAKVQAEEFVGLSEAIQFERDLGYYGNSYALGVVRIKTKEIVWANSFINKSFCYNTIEVYLKKKPAY